ncbi:hypothetical protein [Primorskyibacter marinus]|uniref:hypothetical protein n=1 Tax=Primorskyibacter marinus TaxID=1977320 RepID=UPI001300AD1B|nr:hypothetical protein [Primorskyibacter marinus]
MPRFSMPGPFCCHFRTAPDDIHPTEYKDADKLFVDIAATYKTALEQFYEAGVFALSV